jgi:ubiquinone/menaquinone biosynthesis C-methylase UbiE
VSSYLSLAPYYDVLTRDVDYAFFANTYEKFFGLYNVKPETVLDLACGTGTLTWLLAERGYELIGVDISSEMLAVASDKISNKAKVKPVFINQSMQELDLYGTVDAAICSLDGMNYVPPEEVGEVLRRLGLFIKPGGILIFDINSPIKLKNLDGEVCIDETKDIFCVWRTEFDVDELACFYGMDIFARDDECWQRFSEEHIEYVHQPETLISELERQGFSHIKLFGDDAEKIPDDNSQRIFISALNDAIHQKNR